LQRTGNKQGGEGPQGQPRKPILADALKSYQLKYLLVENLPMVSFYHQNPVASCLTVLNSYAPDQIVNLAADRVMQQNLSIGDEFSTAVTATNGQRLGHAVHPGLADLKQQLLDLR
jgi:hypothetical protein